MYRDALAMRFAGRGTPITLTHPDMAGEITDLATSVRPDGLLRSIDAVLACREALDLNVKPRFAIAAMVATLIAARTA